MNANDIYAAWRAASPEERPQLEGQIYAELQKYAYALVWTHYRGAPNPKDLVKTAVAKALEKMGEFRGESQFLTWFRRVTINVINDALRAKQARREEVLDEDMEVPRDDVEASNSKLFLEQITAELPEDDKVFLRMKLEQWNETEIAEATGLTVEGVRSRWDRIKKRIRAGMGVVTASSMGATK